MSLKDSHCGFSSSLVLALVGILALGQASPGLGEAVSPGGITISGPDSLACDSGATVSFLLRVEAPAGEEGSYPEILEHPLAWKAVLGPKIRNFAMEQGALRLLAFQIPLDTPPGNYPLRYALDHPEGVIEKRVEVRVPARPGLRVKVLDRPSLLIAGEEGRIRFLVSNRGNTDLDLQLEVTCRSGWPVALSQSRIHIPAGMSRSVAARVWAPTGLDHKMRPHIRFSARAAAPHQDLRTESAELLLDAVPRISRGTDPWRRLPTELQLLANLSPDGTGLSGQWRGRGHLDGQGRHELDILLRGPDSRGFGAFGRREEYRAALRSPGATVYLGDGAYSLSPLTRGPLRSRGAELSLDTPGGLRSGAFLIERPGGAKQREVGAYLGSRTGEGDRWRLNFLGKPSGSGGGNLNVGMASLEAAFSLTEDLASELEASLSRDGATGGAYRILLSKHLGSLRYRLERIYASEDFRGSYRDHDYLSGEMGASLGDSWNLHFLGRRWKRKVYDQGLVHPGWEHRAEMGVQHRPRRGVVLGLSGILADHRSSAVGKDWREGLLRMESGLTGSGLSLGLRLEMGERRGDSSGVPNELLRATLSARTQLRSWLSLSLAGTRNRVTGGLNGGTSDTGQITLLATPNARMSFSLRASASEYRFQTHSRYRQVDLTGRYRISRAFWLDMQARLGQSGDRDWEPSLMVGITRSLGLPLARTARLAHLEGRIVDRESGRDAGVADLLLRLDDHTAVTDEDGRFSFPNIPAGDYRLDLPRPSLGVGQALVEKAPLRVSLDEGDRREIQLSVARTSTLSGHILLYATSESRNRPGGRPEGLYLEGRGRTNWSEDEGADPPLLDENLLEMGGQEGVLLRLSGQGRIFYRLSDAQGRFQFEELPPGAWLLEVEDAPLPANHFLEEKLFAFELLPGENALRDFRILPSFRPVRIIDQESLRADAPPAGKDPRPVLSSRRSPAEGNRIDPVHRPVVPPGTDEPGAPGRPHPGPSQRPAPGASGVHPEGSGGAGGGGRPELGRFDTPGGDHGAGQLHGAARGPVGGQGPDLRYGHPAPAPAQPCRAGPGGGGVLAESLVPAVPSRGVLDSLLSAGGAGAQRGSSAGYRWLLALAGLALLALAGVAVHRRRVRRARRHRVPERARRARAAGRSG